MKVMIFILIAVSALMAMLLASGVLDCPEFYKKKNISSVEKEFL